MWFQLSIVMKALEWGQEMQPACCKILLRKRVGPFGPKKMDQVISDDFLDLTLCLCLGASSVMKTKWRWMDVDMPRTYMPARALSRCRVQSWQKRQATYDFVLLCWSLIEVSSQAAAAIKDNFRRFFSRSPVEEGEVWISRGILLIGTKNSAFSSKMLLLAKPGGSIQSMCNEGQAGSVKLRKIGRWFYLVADVLNHISYDRDRFSYW